MTITASTRLYGLFGAPARHSLSPILQNSWMADHDMNAVYLAFEVAPDGFERAVDGLVLAGLAGANITSPFKERAAALADTCKGDAAVTACANTLIFDADETVAYSTDGAGFLIDIDARAPRWRDGTGPVVILGAGGAARAIALALAHQGCAQVSIVNRTLARAEDIVSVLPEGIAQAWSWADMPAALAGASLVVNATTLGLKGINPLDLDLSPLDQAAVVYDTVYMPRDTALVRSAMAQGFATCDGLGMLVGQGALSFQHWFGVLPDMARGIARLKAALAP